MFLHRCHIAFKIFFCLYNLINVQKTGQFSCLQELTQRAQGKKNIKVCISFVMIHNKVFLYETYLSTTE